MNKLQLLETVLGQGQKANRDYYQFMCPFHIGRHGPKLGISLGTGGWKCWVCSSKGRSISGLFKKLGQDQNKINLSKELWKEKVQYQKTDIQNISLPKEYKPLWIQNDNDFFFKKAKSYVCSRGVTELDIKKYRLGYCVNGRYGDMIIMPSFNEDGFLNYFVARSYLDKTFSIPKDIDKNEVIFDDNQINWDEPLVIVESRLDAITIKRNVIPLNGKQFTKRLAIKIINSQIPKLILCLDGDALEDCLRLSDLFIKNGIPVFKANIPYDQDPSSLGTEKIWEYINKAEEITNSDLFTYKLKNKLNL